MTRNPNQTFGMKTPTDLYHKLIYDIERLRNGNSSTVVSYAAMDCAIDATHLADWVLRAVSDDHHKRLTGKSIKTDGEVNLKGFNDKVDDRIPTLAYCRDIANHAKHVMLTRSKPMDIITGRSIKFHPPIDFRKSFPDDLTVTPYAYIIVEDEKCFVIDLFDDAAIEWKTFLIEEGLFDHDLDDHLNSTSDPN